MTCFFDENLPPKLANALDILEGDSGIRVIHIRDKFPASTPDIEWIQTLGKIENCFVITKDRNIKRNPHEFLAWKESKLKIVFLNKSWKNQSFWDISWKFLKNWNELKKKILRANALILPIKGQIEELNNLF